MKTIVVDIPDAQNHYQDHRAFTVYLALRFPEEHYLYKYGMFKKACELFDFPLGPKKGSNSNIEKYYSFCEMLKPFLLEDDQLIRLHHSRLDKEIYQDPGYNLLTQDFIYASVNHNLLNDSHVPLPNTTHEVPVEILNIADLIATRRSISLKGRRSIDYEIRDKRLQEIGKLAELFVLKYEEDKWKNSKYRKRIVHASSEYGDGLGYDIESIDEKGNKTLIEVKGTTGHFSTPFYVTQNELECSIQNPKEYRLYRVYDFNRTSLTGAIKIIKGSLEAICKQPVNYIVGLEKNHDNSWNK